MLIINFNINILELNKINEKNKILFSPQKRKEGQVVAKCVMKVRYTLCVVCPRVSVEDDGWRSGDAGHTPRMYGEAASCPHSTHCLSLSVPSSHDSADI